MEDELLIQASQLYEKSRTDNDSEEAINQLLLEASQEMEKQLAKYTESEQKTLPTLMTEAGSQPESNCTITRFSCAKSASDIGMVRMSAIPKKTQQNTEWAERAWFNWATQQVEKLSSDEAGSGHVLEKTFALMKVEAMNYWLCRFILERGQCQVKNTTLIVYINCAVVFNGV